MNILQMCITSLLPCCSKSMLIFCSTVSGSPKFTLKIVLNLFLLFVIEILNIIMMIANCLIYTSTLNSILYLISFIMQKIIFMITMVLIASGTGFLSYQCQQVLDNNLIILFNIIF